MDQLAGTATGSETEVFPLLKLPDLVFRHVFTKLDVMSLIHVSRTCRDLRWLATDSLCWSPVRNIRMLREVDLERATCKTHLFALMRRWPELPFGMILRQERTVKEICATIDELFYNYSVSASWEAVIRQLPIELEPATVSTDESDFEKWLGIEREIQQITEVNLNGLDRPIPLLPSALAKLPKTAVIKAAGCGVCWVAPELGEHDVRI